MTKKIKTICIGVMVIILAFSLYLIDRFSYSKQISFFPLTVDNDTTLTIGIIGDSWVADRQLDSILHNGLLEKGFENKILSSGHRGARSKLIYQNLFEEKGNENSSKFIIESTPDYCIVIAGVNDAAAQIGGNFYSYHMSLIIKTLLHYKIKPIIVSCPEFGIKETIDNMNVLSKKRRLISAYFNNNGEIDNIKTYRKILAAELDVENLQDSILPIDFDNVCRDYHKCPELYANSLHLSQKGNEVLCHTIINELIKRLTPAKRI